ncbi:hypothetical protein EVAR_16774_1 [Eumeta japonica]|uniref:Uncharacterized protein n=1 Tax=Eumeta variegata TaxID=151549 RepID=A0A4C1UKV3_EUMVA|nr:hypothetical protein EVAR_16774_1 [Eumeta japonica]
MNYDVSLRGSANSTRIDSETGIGIETGSPKFYEAQFVWLRPPSVPVAIGALGASTRHVCADGRRLQRSRYSKTSRITSAWNHETGCLRHNSRYGRRKVSGDCVSRSTVPLIKPYFVDFTLVTICDGLGSGAGGSF